MVILLAQREGKPDLVLVFHSYIDKSKGTAHMVKIAKEKGIETKVFKEIDKDKFGANLLLESC